MIRPESSDVLSLNLPKQQICQSSLHFATPPTFLHETRKGWGREDALGSICRGLEAKGLVGFKGHLLQQVEKLLALAGEEPARGKAIDRCHGARKLV